MADRAVQTKREIQAILAAAGLRPVHRLGQNFLIDGNLMRKLVATAEIGSGDTVLEVGGGTGSLGELLAVEAGALVVVEVSRHLAPLLGDRFAGSGHVTVIEGDVLDGKHAINVEVIAALRENRPRSGWYMLVANLPYNVATPLLMNLLELDLRLERMTFTIQKEVGERLTARVGSKAFGPLSIAAQTACRVQRIVVLPASAFWPSPKVESVMIRMDRRAHAFEAGDAWRGYMTLVHAAFAHRRKTLRYNLSRFLDEAGMLAAGGVVDLSLRADGVPLETWVELGRVLVLVG